jgi:quercetin dioxygenase-like cupin family protein
MRIIDHQAQDLEDWREGVRTRMRVSARVNSFQLCVFEQWCEPGKGAPTHVHAVEEVLTVLEGRADVWVGSDRASLKAGHSVIVPAGSKHGFRNAADHVLHVEAILAAPTFEATFEDRNEVTRRWLPGDAAPS